MPNRATENPPGFACLVVLFVCLELLQKHFALYRNIFTYRSYYVSLSIFYLMEKNNNKKKTTHAPTDVSGSDS